MKANFICLLILLFSFSIAAYAQPTANCEIDLGPDVTVCNNATFTLNPNAAQNGNYIWTGPAGLSCYTCPSPTVSGLTTGVYNYIATYQTAQCTQKDTIKITVVNGQQPQYQIADDKTICAGVTVSLGGPAFPNTFYQWTSLPSGFISSIPNPSATPLATTRYYLIAFNTSCPYTSVDSVLITVVQPPTLQVQKDTAICNGASVLLGSTVPEPGTTYSWMPNNGTLDSLTVANPLATPLQTTVYQLIATNSACAVSRLVTISVVNLDLEFDTGDTVRICKGGSAPVHLTLTPPGAAISWSPLDNGIQVSGGGSDIVVSPSESMIYNVTAVKPGCTRTKPLYVGVDELPQNLLSIHPSDTTICRGAILLLQSDSFPQAAYPDIEFQWLPAQGQLTPDSFYYMIVSPQDTTTYTRVTINGGCIDTVEVTVNVKESGDINIQPSDTLICPGKSVVLEAIYTAGISDIVWSPPIGLSCTQCDNPVATPSDSTVYTVTGQYFGCPVSASAAINVQPLPAIEFPPDLTICLGDSIALNNALDSTATYNWTSTDPAFVPTTDPQPVVAPTQTATYFVQAENGCPVQRQVTVTVTSAVLTASNDTSICKNFSTILTASGSLPGSFEWSDGQTGQAVIVTPAQTTTYTVTYTYADNCMLTDEVTVTLDGIGPEINFPADKELCPGQSVLLNNTNTPGAVYTWTSNPPGFSSNQAIPSPVSPAQSTQYTVTATLDDCTITKTVDIIVYDATLSVPSDITICEGEVAKITADGSLSGTYVWSNGDTSATITPSPTQNTSYILAYTYGDGCILKDTVNVSVKDNFILKIVADPDTNRINIGEPLSLTAIVQPSQSLSGFQFEWLEEGTVNIGNSEILELNPSTNDSSLIIKVIVTSNNGCVQDTFLRFTLVQPLVVVPNAFTPNNDGVNDVFRLKVLEGSAVVINMEIYNRWGKKIFESADPAPVWDGTADGEEAPSDVYIYVIRWQRGDGALQPPLQGDITLLR